MPTLYTHRSPPSGDPTERRTLVTKPDTSPLRVHGAILVDDAQHELDEARRTFRREYDRGHALSERGLWKQGEEMVDAADAKLRLAEERYAAARGR
jgi:hypothetical protein